MAVPTITNQQHRKKTLSRHHRQDVEAVPCAPKLQNLSSPRKASVSGPSPPRRRSILPLRTLLLALCLVSMTLFLINLLFHAAMSSPKNSIDYSALLLGGTNSFLDRRHQQPGGWLQPPALDEDRGLRRRIPQKEDHPIDDNIVFDFDYGQPVAASTLRKPKVLAEEHAMMVVVVLSRRQNLKRRQAIRETWGRGQAVYFVIGGEMPGTTTSIISNNNGTKASTDVELRQEQDAFRDLIDSVHPDSYRSLPHKLQFALQWVVRNCPSVQWILKVDDDMYVRVASVAKLLLPVLNPASPTVVGHILLHQPVQRAGKWAERSYPHSFYPPWPQGSCGYLMSRAAAHLVADNNKNFVMFQGEDTSLGIWLDGVQNGPVQWINSPLFVNTGDCHIQRHPDEINATLAEHSVIPLVIGHRLTPEFMRRCFDTGNGEVNMTWTRHFYLGMNLGTEHAAHESDFDDGKENSQAALDREESNGLMEAREIQKKQRSAERAMKRSSLQIVGLVNG